MVEGVRVYGGWRDDLGLKIIPSKKVAKDLYEIYIGPQHPGSGHMRITIRVDGDIIVEADPDIGYVHRTMEKLGEIRGWIRPIPLFERMAIHDACNITLPYVLAVEKLMGVEPPLRAKYLRTLLCEINRIGAHLYGFAIFGVFLGHSTMYMWAMGDREVFIELAEALTGARLTHSYPIPGGARRDIPADFPDMARRAVKYLRRRLDEYAKIFLNNPVIRSRLEGVGVIPKRAAAEMGLVGPNARGSGIDYDVRLVHPYDAYPELDFEVPVFEEGDALARTYVRVEEIKQSLRIIEQAVEWLEKHPREPIVDKYLYGKYPPLHKKVLESEGRAKLLPTVAAMKVPAGRAIGRAETGRGETVYYVESDGGVNPYRVRIVTASARNVIAFKYVLPGHRVMDIPAIYGSLDYFPPEADR
ncbi:NADH-quinone oxidoreductase subunit D [Aeropyrum camini]|uniref:NADH dehydrogenase subunit D n=2 Tax=Aeropyrum camini TaxID=229980 RepID=U3TGA9_9CREN|nr:NADH-quinone oxidoreductase subunit D [Aeropyrum camini]BAN90364.1 NADH dehydrogenase subunit D [Aeropyrum camini SY1 = JCM 12091]